MKIYPFQALSNLSKNNIRRVKPTLYASELGKICRPGFYSNFNKQNGRLAYLHAKIGNTSHEQHEPKSEHTNKRRSQSEYKMLNKIAKSVVNSNDLTFDSQTLLKNFVAHFPNSKFDSSLDSLKLNEPKLYEYVNMLRGKSLQEPILNYINARRQNFSFATCPNAQLLDYNDMFVLSGKIDGLDKREKCIVEIKTRSTFEFKQDTITHFDRVQIVCYMKLFEADYCLFVECGPKGSKELKQTLIKFDENEFEEYMQRVVKFLALFNNQHRI